MDARKNSQYYDAGQIVDAPEHRAFSTALGLFTWGTWDHEMRPFDDRLRDFVMAFPPEDPTRHMGPALARAADGSFVPASGEALLERFSATDGRTGSLLELLARYGLKLNGASPLQMRPYSVETTRAVTRQRNHKLRVLHGGVDIEPADMDAAKAEFLDQQEKRRAADEVRAARRRMRGELAGDVDRKK